MSGWDEEGESQNKASSPVQLRGSTVPTLDGRESGEDTGKDKERDQAHCRREYSL